jgi:hypothetical protein
LTSGLLGEQNIGNEAGSESDKIKAQNDVDSMQKKLEIAKKELAALLQN